MATMSRPAPKARTRHVLKFRGDALFDIGRSLGEGEDYFSVVGEMNGDAGNRAFGSIVYCSRR